MKLRTQIKPKLLDYLLDPVEIIGNEADINQAQLSQNNINNLLTPQDLESKRVTILSKINNDPKTEQDFRETCVLYKSQKSASKPELKRAYKEYVSAYYKITSVYALYNSRQNNIKGANLVIFDTEKRSEKLYSLPSKYLNSETKIIRLPNGELFCFGNKYSSGKTSIIDKDYRDVRNLPSGFHCLSSSLVYFNKNVYCFGAGIGKNFIYENISCRFDLDQNRWITLAQIPMQDPEGQSVVINRNILISGYISRMILLYSIDTDSFSPIQCEFAKNAKKFFIISERLYLIELDENNGFIYESEDNCGYAWNKIAKSNICNNEQVYCSYNKGSLHFVTYFTYNEGGMHFMKTNFMVMLYEFNLAERKWSSDKWEELLNDPND